MEKKANRRLNGNGVCRGICRHCNVVVGLLADSIGEKFEGRMYHSHTNMAACLNGGTPT